MPRHRSSAVLPYFDPQATYDETIARRKQSAGGSPPVGRSVGGRRPIEYIGEPDATNDQGITKMRGPWFHTGNMIPLANPIRWTEAGPIRPEMHFFTFSWRRWSGGAFQNREGLHTMLPRPGLSTRHQMMARGQNRLAIQRFRGQSFSQTTQVLGGTTRYGQR